MVLTGFRNPILQDMDADSLRVEPVGEDSNGQVYWYFYGTRLYMEATKKRQKKKKTDEGKIKGKKEEKAKKKEGSKKKAVVETVEKEEESEGEEEGPAPGWYLICQTEPDWQRLAERLRSSKKKADKELLETLESNFLPEISRMFAQQEREERLRLLMANKRSSSRIDRLRREQEERQLREQLLDEQLGEAALQLEEERRRGGGGDQEKENGPRGGGAQRVSTTKSCGEGLSAALAENREERKRRREAQQDVLRRWQEMEMDHDYLPAKQKRHFHFY